MTNNKTKLLFICTHNRCRSQMYQVLANALFPEHVIAKSAGSQPADAVNDGALAALNRHGYDTDGLYSKSWDELEDFNADLIVTVCDSAAGEVCPVWFGDTNKAHWSTEDPSAFQGSPEAQSAEFDRVIEVIKNNLHEWSNQSLT